MSKYSEKYVYHYCSLETLLAIIKTKQIRFSDLKESNDALEDIVLDDLFKIDENNIPLKEEMIKAKKMTSIFGFCLTFKGDNHELWRIYNDSKGVCLKFQKKHLVNFFSNLFYRNNDAYDLQHKKIKYVESINDKDFKINPVDFNLENLSETYSDFLSESAFIKKKHWNYEKEYRFCFRKFMTDGFGGAILPLELKNKKSINCCKSQNCDFNYCVKSLEGENKRVVLYYLVPFCPYLIDEIIVGQNCPISVEKIETLISNFLGDYLTKCVECQAKNCDKNKLPIINVKSSIYREKTDEEKWLDKVKAEESKFNDL